MASLDSLAQLGRELGYEGEPLLEFIKYEQNQERERRAEEREKLQLELELEKLRQASRHPEGDEEQIRSQLLVPVKGPKLPDFDESSDDLDAYLRRFELFATTAQWPKDSWGILLSSHLKGIALEVYARLPDDYAQDYDHVKKALMDRFECTDEGFRLKFRRSRPLKGEKVEQFVNRIKTYLKRWVALSSCDETFNGVIELMLMEQFMNNCGRNLQVYLKERLPIPFAEMMELAERFVSAHGGLLNNSRTPIETRWEKQNVQKEGKSYTSGSDTGNKPEKVEPRRMVCFRCDRPGHKAFQCKERKKQAQVSGCEEVGSQKPESLETVKPDTSAHTEALSCGYGVEVVTAIARMPVVRGTVCGTEVTILRDTGCSTVVVRKNLVPASKFTGKHCSVRLANCVVERYPLAQVYIECPYFTGTVEAVCMEEPVYDVLIGNVPGSLPLQEMDSTSKPGVSAVVTRTAAQKSIQTRKKLKVPDFEAILSVGRKAFQEAQQEDTSLKTWWEFCKDGKTVNHGKGRLHVDKGLLYLTKENHSAQLVVPEMFRSEVMTLAHESAFGGHQGIGKTLNRIQQDFAWPGLMADVKRHCQSCDICQKTVPRGKVGRVPLGEMPLIDTPFKRVAVDIVGPIEPRSEDKNKYILTLVDYATRYPEAVALPSVETERVAEALMDIFSRVGVPEELISDRGSQFTSHMMQEVRRLLSIRHLPTTPYHAMGNGLVEKYNGTLKQMLKKMCAEQPRSWDRYLPAVLFAYRETPQVSMGFSPFELLYGRTVRGPLSILRDIWDKDKQEDIQTTYQYVFKLRDKLEETCRLAQEHLGKAQGRYKMYYDRKARERKLQVGDQVLILLPTNNNKLLLQWKGPFPVVERKGSCDYRIDVNGELKLFHSNMLKKYYSRPNVNCVDVTAAVVEEEEEEPEQLHLPSLCQKETWRQVKISENLSEEQQTEVRAVLEDYKEVWSDVPGRTSLLEHKITLIQEQVVRTRPYKIPYSLRQEINEQLDEMLRLNIIEPSNSPFSAPMVVVAKPDKTHRICLDFRKLNDITVFDCEPMSDPEHIMSGLHGQKFFSKIDLSRGYWQVPLEHTSKQYTAFQTDRGLFQFVTLPFGLINAPMSFNRLMRKVLDGLSGVKHFLDDILVYSRTWEEHVILLRTVMERLRQAGLTAKPSKCQLGMRTVEYLGHVIGGGELWPMQDKVKRITDAPRPLTKKALRSFLGLSGYYRKFIPHYATIASPLTDMVKKNKPNQLQWEEPQQRAFHTLKYSLSTSPVLRLPDVEEEFILRTDASNVGLGAVVLQEVEGVKHPIAYASKKLLPREQRYSVIEKECLAIVWGIQKFSQYLYGNPFTLETDHKPLKYMQSAKQLNGRIMRWSLLLQQYVMKIKVIKGSENVGADFLSRSSVD